jgi:hypothetical protein
MTYVLKSNNELLKTLREELPLDEVAIDRIKRNDVLHLREAVLAHYEINPFYKGPLKDILSGVNFDKFVNLGDHFTIVDSYRRSNELTKDLFLDSKSILEPVSKTIYVKWACEKGYPLPLFLTEAVIAWKPPALLSVDDVKLLPFEDMSPSVLACIHSNAVAQMYRRSKPSIKISEVYNSPSVQQYLKVVATVEGKEIKAEDTIRGYVEHQFR